MGLSCGNRDVAAAGAIVAGGLRQMRTPYDEAAESAERPGGPVRDAGLPNPVAHSSAPLCPRTSHWVDRSTTLDTNSRPLSQIPTRCAWAGGKKKRPRRRCGGCAAARRPVGQRAASTSSQHLLSTPAANSAHGLGGYTATAEGGVCPVATGQASVRRGTSPDRPRRCFDAIRRAPLHASSHSRFHTREYEATGRVALHSAARAPRSVRHFSSPDRNCGCRRRRLFCRLPPPPPRARAPRRSLSSFSARCGPGRGSVRSMPAVARPNSVAPPSTTRRTATCAPPARPSARLARSSASTRGSGTCRAVASESHAAMAA